MQQHLEKGLALEYGLPTDYRGFRWACKGSGPFKKNCLQDFYQNHVCSVTCMQKLLHVQSSCHARFLLCMTTGSLMWFCSQHSCKAGSKHSKELLWHCRCEAVIFTLPGWPSTLAGFQSGPVFVGIRKSRAAESLPFVKGARPHSGPSEAAQARQKGSVATLLSVARKAAS